MPSPIDVYFTEEQMYSLGAQLGGKQSMLSPFVAATDRRKAASAVRVLNAALVTDDGRIRPELLPAFQTLANTHAFSSVGYVSRSFALEVATYYPRPGSGLPVASLSNTGDGFQLQSPPIATGILEVLRQYIGDGLLRDIELEVDLPIMDAWLFFAVIDAARRAAIQRMLGSTGDRPGYLNLEGIYKGLEPENSKMAWLAPYFDDCLSLATPSFGEVEKGIGRLAERGWVRLSGQEVILADMMENLADDFLVINGHLRIRAAALDSSGQAVTSDVRVIQGRAGLNFAWSHDQRSIDLFTLSPAQTLLLVSSIVEDPASVLDEDALRSNIGGSASSPESLY